MSFFKKIVSNKSLNKRLSTQSSSINQGSTLVHVSSHYQGHESKNEESVNLDDVQLSLETKKQKIEICKLRIEQSQYEIKEWKKQLLTMDSLESLIKKRIQLAKDLYLKIESSSQFIFLKFTEIQQLSKSQSSGTSSIADLLNNLDLKSSDNTKSNMTDLEVLQKKIDEVTTNTREIGKLRLNINYLQEEIEGLEEEIEDLETQINSHAQPK